MLNQYLQPLTLDVEEGFVLGEDFALVEAGGSAGFSESSDTAMESARWISNNKCLVNIVEGDRKLGIVGRIRSL